MNKPNYNIIQGDLIELALSGHFDVIAHGVNCFNAQLSGLAPQMVKAFGTDRFHYEHEHYIENIGKLGMIDTKLLFISPNFNNQVSDMPTNYPKEFPLVVVNCYTQFEPGPNADIHALAVCLKKINHVFIKQRIGLPKIGCGIGGLDWDDVEPLFKKYLTDCDVTVVEYVSANNKEETLENSINFTPKKFAAFKRLFRKAELNSIPTFVFEGHEINTAYAKYMIEYLSTKFTNK